MRKFLLFGIVAACTAGAAFAQDVYIDDNGTAGTMYIIPVTAEGTLPTLQDGNYQGQVPMEIIEGAPGVWAKDVRIIHGFVFEGVSHDKNARTFFKLSGSLNLEGENTLSITSNPADNKPAGIIDVPAGVYTINLTQPSGAKRIFTLTRTQVVSGIDAPEIASETVRQYFDISGIPVEGVPTLPGIYIVREGMKTFKAIIR